MGTQSRSVIVIGGGTMGRGIVQVFAQAGFPVRVFDAIPAVLEKVKTSISDGLRKQVEKGKMAAADAEATAGRISVMKDLRDVGEAQLAVEAVVEQLGIKMEVLKTLDAALPADAILASNTSSIPITQLAASTKNPGRFIGMHFFNPVPIMKLVEVVLGADTTDGTYQRTAEMAKTLGKTPLKVNDYPGFVSNRVLMPLINEAIDCLSDGVSDAETIDQVMQLGCAHTMGPLHTADLIGLDVCLAIMEVLHRDLGLDRYRPSPLLRKMVHAGRLGRKTKRGFFVYD